MNFLNQRRLTLLVMFVIFLVFNIYYWKSTKVFNTLSLFNKNYTSLFTTHLNTVVVQKLKPKYILYWIPFWDQKDYYIGSGFKPFKNCEYKNCYATYERNFMPIENFDVLIFHGIYEKSQIEHPRNRSSNQIYVYMNVEAPTYICPNLKPYRSFFNWTMTYRFDSDLVRRHGEIMKKVPGESPPSIDLSSKKKLAAWFVSHCHTASKREILAKEIQKHMPVDVYGYCGNLTCRHSKTSPKLSSEECYDMVEKQYKFYFSFENSYCQDYSTEKLYNILKRNVVPIVYGAGDYAISAPPNSVIDASKFSNAKKLAEYLIYLDNNDIEYLKYFQWKENYTVQNSNVACSLCRKLNEPIENFAYDDLYTWWWGKNRLKCKTGKNLPKIVSSLL